MMPSNDLLPKGLCLLLCLLSFSVSAANPSSTLNSTIAEQSASQKNSLKSQQRINQLSQQSTDMTHEYQQISEQLNTLQIYNQQLEKLLQSQQTQIARRIEQLNSIEQTEQSIVPLMLQMINSLEQFIQLDMPFLLDERQQRVAELKRLMDQANVSSAEKYRQILQAFLAEMDFGRTVEAWQGNHPDDQNLVVNFFRMGRVALIYQSLDKQSAFYWSKEEDEFKPLPPEYLASLERGFRVARKQAAPEFIKVPVSAPKNKTSASGGSDDN